MDFIVDFLVDLLGEAVLQALAPVLLAFAGAAGTFCLLYRATNGALAGGAALAAFICGLCLTYFGSQGSKGARNLLLAGALVGGAVVGVFLLRTHTS